MLLAQEFIFVKFHRAGLDSSLRGLASEAL